MGPVHPPGELAAQIVSVLAERGQTLATGGDYVVRAIRLRRRPAPDQVRQAP